MLSIAHTIISIPFGIFFKNPVLAFSVAFLMHLFCDHLLHWNIYPHKMAKYPFLLVALDVISGLGASYLIAGNAVFTVSVLAAIAGGNTPDILHALWGMLAKNQRKNAPKLIRTFFAFHVNIQRETDSIPKGLVSQIVLGGLAIIITRALL